MYQGPPQGNRISVASVESIKKAELNKMNGIKEAVRLAQEAEDAYWEDFIPDREPALEAPEKKEAGPFIEKFNDLVTSFKETFPLEKLLKIKDISYYLALKFEYADDLESPERIKTDVERLNKHGQPGAADKYLKVVDSMQKINLEDSDQEIFDFRRASKSALASILDLYTVLDKETDISPEKLEELRNIKSTLVNAQGGLNMKDYVITH